MYFCYLLTSKRTPTSKATYIGFSTQPIHRLRQHNGEIVAGARKTSKYRPWVHVAIVSGFPNKITALQFEWQWQHPDRTRITGKTLSKRSGYKRCLDELVSLLNKSLWKQLNLNVLFPNEDYMNDFQRIIGSDITTSCTFISETFAVTATSRACNTVNTTLPDTCASCKELITSEATCWTCTNCDKTLHVVCTANKSVVSDESLVPDRGDCAHCNYSYPWSEIVRKVRKAANAQNNDDDNDGSIDMNENDTRMSNASELTDQTPQPLQITDNAEIIELLESDVDSENIDSEDDAKSYSSAELEDS